MKKWIIGLSLVIIPMLAFSQKTGSIHGVVTDKETGQTLQGAEVLVVEISKGAITSGDGTFLISGIEPGTYTVQAHLLGFATQTFENIQIKAGKSTEVVFSIAMQNISLGEVTVSATKINTTINKIGSPVYIIGKKDIELTEGRNIEEVLLKVPGVFTEDRFHNGTNLVSFRGVGLHTHVTRGILVLVDGVSITEAMGRTDFEQVDMTNAEKVEILKGPVSALYGPNGITGVINIVEKSPDEGVHGKATASYGSYNTMSFSGDVNGGKNGFKYLVKGKYFSTDGYQQRSDSYSARGGIKMSQQFNKAGKLQLMADYVNFGMNIPGSIDSALFYGKSTESRNKYAGYNRDYLTSTLLYTNSFGDKINLFANVYYRNKNEDGFYADYAWSDSRINTYGGEARTKFSHGLFGRNNTFIVGVSVLSEDGWSETYLRDDDGILGRKTSDGDSRYNLFGAYAEDEFMLFQKLAITLGLRYDLVAYDWLDKLNDGEDNTSGSTTISSFSPKFGMAYNPTNNLTVFGNIARGFNPPQISQLYIGSSYSGIPNPNLKPEYLINYELGARGNIKAKFVYQLSFYYMNFKDQITAEIDPEIDPETPVYQNIGNTRHAGLETALEYHFSPYFYIYGNYSYLDARFNNDPEYGNNLLRKTPHNMMNAGINYSFKFGLTTAVEFKYVGKYYMDNDEVNEYEGYSLMNLKLMYRWKGLTTVFAVNNLYNTYYATYAYASQRYDPVSHSTYWSKSYIPGWPVNFNLSVSYGF